VQGTPADIAGENGLLKQLDQGDHRACDAGGADGRIWVMRSIREGQIRGTAKRASGKRLKGDFGTLEIACPRDGNELPSRQLVAKGETRWHGFRTTRSSLYAARHDDPRDPGPTWKNVPGEVSHADLERAEAVMDEVKAWQSRPLDAVYPIVYLDALVVKMRTDGRFENRAVHVALGIGMMGTKRCWGCGQRQRGG